MISKNEWSAPPYLIYKVATDWSPLLKGTFNKDKFQSKKLKEELSILFGRIAKSKRYELLYEYSFYFSSLPVDLITIEDLQGMVYCVSMLYHFSNIYNKRLLICRDANNNFIWGETPDKNDGLDLMDKDLSGMWIASHLLLILVAFLDKHPNAKLLSNLLVPKHNQWPKLHEWITPVLVGSDIEGNNLSALEFGIESSLEISSNNKASTSPDYFRKILTEATLTQRYKIQEGFPVLIKTPLIEGIDSVILVKIEKSLIANILTLNKTTSLPVIINLENGEHLDFFKSLPLKPQINSFILPTLVSTIYKDLVTAKEVNKPRTYKPSSTKKSSKPQSEGIRWRYIPRKIYIPNSTDEEAVTRELLTESEQERQNAIKRYHMVCGHIRHYRNKEGWLASEERIEMAKEDGIILHEGETYVKPYSRGKKATDELGEIDINSIPHYLRRGK